MEAVENREQSLAKVVSKLLNVIIALIAVIIFLLITLAVFVPKQVKHEAPTDFPQPDANGNFTNAARAAAFTKTTDTVAYWQAPDLAILESAANKDQINYGRELITHTSLYFGPNGSVGKNFTNGMNCQNCHLDAGTKIFGNNYSAVASTYPKYRARSGEVENIKKRINDCFERSLNGRPIDTASGEMEAIVAYINWLGKDVPQGEKPAGSGFSKIAFLDVPADPQKGTEVYKQKCQACHQANGEGILNTDKTAYIYPPLWGPNSYNTGAGLYRMSNFAKFVKSNMPLGATYANSQLTDQEAWDVAAFVNSRPRPEKDVSKDWPHPEEKPFDHPFGPFVDGFTEKQHKYGPFQPIKEKLETIKKTKT